MSIRFLSDFHHSIKFFDLHKQELWDNIIHMKVWKWVSDLRSSFPPLSSHGWFQHQRRFTKWSPDSKQPLWKLRFSKSVRWQSMQTYNTIFALLLVNMVAMIIQCKQLLTTFFHTFIEMLRLQIWISSDVRKSQSQVDSQVLLEPCKSLSFRRHFLAQVKWNIYERVLEQQM